MDTVVQSQETNEDENVCAICLYAYEDNDRIITYRCGHKFHLHCAFDWVCTQLRQNVHITCPSCRYIQYFRNTASYIGLKRDMGIETTVSPFEIEVEVEVDVENQQQPIIIRNLNYHHQALPNMTWVTLAFFISVIVIIFVVVLTSMIDQ